MELILIRHGLPEHVETEDGTPADPNLSEVGREQAQRMASLLAEIEEELARLKAADPDEYTKAVDCYFDAW